jgi:CHAT domain-containing protein
LLPFKEEIRELDHLILVPIYNIATLPIAAFRLDEHSHFIDELSFSICPSLPELGVSHRMNETYKELLAPIRYRKDKGYPNGCLFISNPDYPKVDGTYYPNLPGAEKEVSQLVETLGEHYYAKILSGDSATESGVLNEIGHYSIVHFATHAVSSSENSLDSSFLVLSVDQNHNGFLTAREIQDLRKGNGLSRSLIVLSACQTGLGQTSATGMIGLGRAFQIAGASHVVMSLWKINDGKTPIIMALFYEKLLRSERVLSPHEAMREAMIQYRDTVDDDPSVWASFTIFGIPMTP